MFKIPKTYSTKLLILLTLALSYSMQSQEVTHEKDYDKWRVIRFDSGEVYAYTKGYPIENTELKPDLTLVLDEKSKTYYFRLDAVDLYEFDHKGVNNYVEVDIIVDDGDILNYEGRLVNTELDDGNYEVWVNIFKKENGDSLDLLVDQIKKGNNVYVRTTGASDPLVFKFSARGFTAAFFKAVEFNGLNKKKNPFAKSNDNPFHR